MLRDQAVRLQLLPDEVIATIVSSASITCLNQVVLGLFKNALDSGASKIEIQVTPSRGCCTVKDNGTDTSKTNQTDSVHGKTGSFLASVAALACLSISSKHRAFRSANQIAFHNSQVVLRSAPVSNPIQVTDGTTVVVHDLFGHLPVRIKQRALHQLDAYSGNREWHQLRFMIAAHLLCWHTPLDIKLSNQDLDRAVHVFTSDFNPTPPILKQFDLLGSHHQDAWVPATASTKNVAVKAMINARPWPTKHLQFVSIGIEPIDRESRPGIYKLINSIFERSDFGHPNFDNTHSKVVDTGRYALHPPSEPYKQEKHPSRRKGDQWPVFSVLITFQGHGSTSANHLHDELSTTSRISRVLTALVEQWLTKQNFVIGPNRTSHYASGNNLIPCNSRGKDSMNTKGTATTDEPGPNSQCPTRNPVWSRIKDNLDDLEHPSIHAYHHNQDSSNHLASPPGQSCRNGEPVDDQVIGNTSIFLDSTQNSTLPWIDSNTKSQNKANLKTGLMVLESIDRISRSPYGRLTIRPSSWQPRCTDQDFLERDPTLIGWKNAVFSNPEVPIAVLNHHCNFEFGGRSTFQIYDVAKRYHLSKSGLRHARFISQFNQQFLLIAITSDEIKWPSHEILVAVDQHAADERCKLEGYFEKLFKAPAAHSHMTSKLGPVKPLIDFVELDRSMIFHIPALEARHFQVLKQSFVEWGIIYDLDQDLTAPLGDDHVIKLKTLPPVIAARCVREPDLLISFLRKHLWTLVEDKPSVSLPEDPSICHKQHSWLRKIGRCPDGILKMLFSKACRHAIMFNDVLSREECLAIIENLGKCAFPFQCAHGRPSMVPILKLVNPKVVVESEVLAAAEKPDCLGDFLTAFDRWKRSQ